MTKIIKTLLSFILTFTTVLAVFGSITAQAQYGGTTITLPTKSNPGSSVTTTTTSTNLNANNRCSGSNVSSSVAGETLNINLCNIKSGNTIVLNNLSTSFVESIELTFKSDVNDGLFQLVKIPESLAYSNISGSFIIGFEALTTRFDSTAISSVKLNFKVDKSSLAKYTSINAYTAVSPWVSTNLTKISEDSAFVRYSSTVGPFRQYALAGTTNTSASPISTTTSFPASKIDLIRTGGQTQFTGMAVLVLGLLAAYTVVSKRNILKI